MRLVYVDESYCNVCYYVVALLVPDTEAQALTTALNTVVRRATASYYGIGPTAELHGYDLFQGKGHWEVKATGSRSNWCRGPGSGSTTRRCGRSPTTT